MSLVQSDAAAAAPTPVCALAPVGLLAELTHRCPLQCPYCSNPLALERVAGELSTADWQRVMTEAAELGVLHLHLSGGEPTLRPDLEQIVETASTVGLYTNLITAAVGLSRARLETLAKLGLDHVQISIQDAEAGNANRIGGAKNGHAQKLQVAGWVRELGLPLTINAPLHRQNIHGLGAMIQLAEQLGAGRIEVAHVQYYGWALRNRAALLPTMEQVQTTIALVEAERKRLKGRMVIDFVAPDYHASRPKPCMGGWGRTSMNVTPTGRVLPCHAAETIPGLTFENVRDKPLRDIWLNSPSFAKYRGTDWMQEPCRSCSLKEVDWGGCRCQALLLAGDAAAADPVCAKSPLHGRVRDLAAADSQAVSQEFVPRNYRTAPPAADGH
jgi:PqqA peptide cyclase